MSTILVYRDTVGARSESFIVRQYCAFRELEPIYVGTKRGPLAPQNSVILAAPGLLGVGTRLPFRQWGRIPGSLALPVAIKADLPLVVTFHGGDAAKDKHFIDRRFLPTIFHRRRQTMIEKASAIFCVSHFVREKLLARGFPAAKLHTHYLGIDIPRDVMLMPAGISSTVLFVGRLVEKKGVDTLLAAMAIARRADPALELVVIGDGPARADLERRATATGLKADFRGWQGEKDVRSAMRRALLLAVPSQTASGGDSEGLPTVLMEAMALGTPVVATRHAGIPEIVSDGVTGLLVPEADPEALARAIATIRQDAELAGRLRGEAYADIRARFDARRQSALLERSLIQIIEARARSEYRLPAGGSGA